MKPKGKVYNHFLEKPVNGRTIYVCKYCDQLYKNRNATRMSAHLIKNCCKCPEVIKTFLQKQDVLMDVTNTALIRTRSTSESFNENIRSVSRQHSDLEVVGNVGSSNSSEHFDYQEAQQALARAIFVAGQPLSLVEHPLWREFFKLLRSEFRPPTRKALSTSFLDEEYLKIKREIDLRLKNAKVLHVALDGWTNIKNEPIINIIVFTPIPYFYKFIETKQNRHTASYLFEETCKVLENIGSDKVMLIITDNAANMVKCGGMLENKYTNVKWVGCLAHTLNLLIGDVLKNEHVAKMISDATDIIKCVQHSHILTADLNQFRMTRESRNLLCCL